MKSGIISTASRFFLSTDGAARGEAEFIQTFPSRERGRRRSMLSGTVFQTALFSSVIIPRLRPGLLSLRSVLSSRQQNNKTTKQPDNKTTRQQNNQTTKQPDNHSLQEVWQCKCQKLYYRAILHKIA